MHNSLIKSNMVDDILDLYCSSSRYWDTDLSPKRYNSTADNLYRIMIKDVIFNDPATIVFWTDGSKTVVKCKGKDAFDPEKGLAMAIVKKVFGNQGNYYNQIKKWLEP